MVKKKILGVVAIIIIAIVAAKFGGLFALIAPGETSKVKDNIQVVVANKYFGDAAYGDTCGLGQALLYCPFGESDECRHYAGSGDIGISSFRGYGISNIKAESRHPGVFRCGTAYIGGWFQRINFTYNGNQYSVSNTCDKEPFDTYLNCADYSARKRTPIYLYPDTPCEVSLKDGQIIASIGNAQAYETEVCVELKLTLKPDITLKTIPAKLIFEFTNATIPLVFQNNFLDKTPVKIFIDYSFQTPTGIFTDTKIIEQNLTLGDNTIPLQLPTAATGTLFVATKAYISTEEKGVKTGTYNPERQRWSGDPLAYWGRTSPGASYFLRDGREPFCRWNDRIQYSDVWACAGERPVLVPIEAATQSFQVLISPLPIYLNKTCSADADCGPNYACYNELCIREDISNAQLPCQQLGCPVVEGHEYMCTSAGVCAELVFLYKDCYEMEQELNKSVCPEGTKCDPTSGACIKTEIYEAVIQCQTTADCQVPCQGISVACENSKCVYSGECETITEVEIMENVIIKGCADLGCEEGYVCTPRGVCEKETIITKIIYDYRIIVVLISAIVILGGLFWWYRK